MSGSGESDWKHCDVEENGEEKNRRDEIRLGEDGKTVC